MRGVNCWRKVVIWVSWLSAFEQTRGRASVPTGSRPPARAGLSPLGPGRFTSGVAVPSGGYGNRGLSRAGR